MNRKQRRTLQKKLKHEANEKLSEKISLFNQLEEECLACTKTFDKSNKDMVTSWQVVVREESNQVRLFCPDCLEKTQKVIEKYG